MEWAKELFLHDCGLSSWSEVKKTYGVIIEPMLRTYAAVLKRDVKAVFIKKIKNLGPLHISIGLKRLQQK